MTSTSPLATPPRSAGRALVESLQQHRVERIFCVPGESYLEVLDALHDAPDIDLVVAKHEGAAACMAEADGKLTGRPGICMVTRGPGATHASVGVHIAQQDSTPMILFIGQIARNHVGREAFQEVDYQAMFGKLAKWVVEVTDAERMPEILARAFHLAVSGRPGPVVVALPEDMLLQDCTVPVCAATPVEEATLSAQTLERITQALSQAQRPLVMVGGPDWTPAARQALQTFAGRWQLPVACGFRRQDALDNNDAHYAGHLSLGMNPKLIQRIKDCDLILAIGTRIGDIETDGYTLLQPPRIAQRLIHIHADPAELGRVFQADLAAACTAGSALRSLAATAPGSPPPWQAWTAQARNDHLAFVTPPAPHPQLQGPDLAAVMQHMAQVLPADSIVTNGAGNYAVWLHRFYRYRASRTQLAPTCGSMGYGLPAAVAAALRHRDRDVICLAGDGCFLMYPQELATAQAHGARLTVLVVNNGMYGTIRMHQEKLHPGRVSGTQLSGPDYVQLAKAFGAHAERVQRTEDFAPAFARARQHDGISLLELCTDPQQITPAMRLSR